MNRHKDCISVKDLKDNYLYIIAARNFKVGVYEQNTNSFIGARYKFKKYYLDKEIHYDIDQLYGTACPIKCLGKNNLKDKELLNYLIQYDSDNKKNIYNLVYKEKLKEDNFFSKYIKEKMNE